MMILVGDVGFEIFASTALCCWNPTLDRHVGLSRLSIVLVVVLGHGQVPLLALAIIM